MMPSNQTCNCVDQMKHQCIEFTRSTATYGDISCRLGPREQLNLVTSFIDGSVVYGTRDDILMTLRDTKEKGALKTQKRGKVAGDLLPANENSLQKSDCLDATNTTKCFLSGRKENLNAFKYNTFN